MTMTTISYRMRAVYVLLIASITGVVAAKGWWFLVPIFAAWAASEQDRLSANILGRNSPSQL